MSADYDTFAQLIRRINKAGFLVCSMFQYDDGEVKAWDCSLRPVGDRLGNTVYGVGASAEEALENAFYDRGRVMSEREWRSYKVSRMHRRRAR